MRGHCTCVLHYGVRRSLGVELTQWSPAPNTSTCWQSAVPFRAPFLSRNQEVCKTFLENHLCRLSIVVKQVNSVCVKVGMTRTHLLCSPKVQMTFKYFRYTPLWISTLTYYIVPVIVVLPITSFIDTICLSHRYKHNHKQITKQILTYVYIQRWIEILGD